MPTPVRRLDLPFAAPVPRGHEVTWLQLRHPQDMKGQLVIDATSGIVYCEDEIRGLLAFPSAASEPLVEARKHGWQVEHTVSGNAVGCTVSSVVSAVARSTSMRTLLFVEPADG